MKLKEAAERNSWGTPFLRTPPVPRLPAEVFSPLATRDVFLGTDPRLI